VSRRWTSNGRPPPRATRRRWRRCRRVGAGNSSVSCRAAPLIASEPSLANTATRHAAHAEEPDGEPQVGPKPTRCANSFVRHLGPDEWRIREPPIGGRGAACAALRARFGDVGKGGATSKMFCARFNWPLAARRSFRWQGRDGRDQRARRKAIQAVRLPDASFGMRPVRRLGCEAEMSPHSAEHFRQAPLHEFNFKQSRTPSSRVQGADMTQRRGDGQNQFFHRLKGWTTPPDNSSYWSIAAQLTDESGVPGFSSTVDALSQAAQ